MAYCLMKNPEREGEGKGERHTQRHRDTETQTAGCAVYKIEFALWKTFLTFTFLLVCLLTSAINIFSEVHGMSCFHIRDFKLE